MSKREEKILAHDYDGIREYDNPLPGWWLFIFYGSMVWALVYGLFYHFGPGLLGVEAHEAAMAEMRREAARAAIAGGLATDEAVLAVAASDAHVEQGRQLYDGRCSECHGRWGEGGTGPNLTDQYWLHGGSPGEVLTTIRDGYYKEGMPGGSWIVRQDEVWALAAHVESLRGTSPPNAKAPEGRPWVPGTPSAARLQALTATLERVLASPDAVSRGQATFLARCMPCHGTKGEGLVGPNLTDGHWIHGGALTDIFHVVSNGVPEKGMVPWKNQLSAQEIREVTAYVATLRGTNVPGKPPEGEPWTPEAEAAGAPAGT